MKFLFKYLPWIALVAAIIFAVSAWLRPPELVTETITLEVPVPVVEKVFDTIKEPVPVERSVIVKEIDSTYYEEYMKLKDSIAKDSMFREAIKINEYEQKFEDSIQTINVYSKTRGKLLEQTVDYKTKPRTIEHKEDITFKKSRLKVSLGGEFGMPILSQESMDASPTLKGNMYITNGKDNSLILSADTDGRVWVGYVWKIKFRR